MKVRTYREFGALNSAEVFSAFEQGLSYSGDTLTDKRADVVVIWSVLFAGRMAMNEKIWKQCQATKTPVVVLEVGAIKRGVTWKVGIGGINRSATFVKPFEENRHEKIGISLAPWKKGPGFVTIFTQRPDSLQWSGMRSVESWVSDHIKEIRKHTKRDILLRPHPRDRITNWSSLAGTGVYVAPPVAIGVDAFDHERVFKETYFAINHSSGPSVQCAIDGIHIACSQDSLAYDVSDSVSSIETPSNKDRNEWANMIAHTEWTIEEIKAGIPWKHLRSNLL